jgi:hypothetical protein
VGEFFVGLRLRPKTGPLAPWPLGPIGPLGPWALGPLGPARLTGFFLDREIFAILRFVFCLGRSFLPGSVGSRDFFWIEKFLKIEKLLSREKNLLD